MIVMNNEKDLLEWSGRRYFLLDNSYTASGVHYTQHMRYWVCVIYAGWFITLLIFLCFGTKAV